MEKNSIVAFDLAWSGPTGWSAYNMELERFTAWGEIRAGYQAEGTGVERNREIGLILAQGIRGVVGAYAPGGANQIALVAYEVTDWHQDSSDTYAQGRERTVRTALGRAEGVLLVTVPTWLDVVSYGAVDVKVKFGAMQKEETARMLAAQFPDQFVYGQEGGMVSLEDGKPVSHHVTDSMALAYVASNDYNLKRLVERGE